MRSIKMFSSINVANISTSAFTEDQLSKDPIVQFNMWYENALSVEGLSAHHMTLGTTNHEGKPRSRQVWLQDSTAKGFIFLTSYTSPKAKELEKNPFASLNFNWPSTNRSIRVEGKVEKLPPDVNAKFFKNREEHMKIVDHMCDLQSSPIGGKQELEKLASEIFKKFKDTDIPMPENWGGYVVKPSMIEFIKLHCNYYQNDRIRFWRKKPNENTEEDPLAHGGENGWFYTRLIP